MEGIIAVIIIAALAKLNSNANKVKQNAPGQSGRPQQSAEPARQSTQLPRPVMQPTVQPTVKPTAPNGSFWEQMMDALEDTEAEVRREVSKMQPAQVKPAPIAPHKGHAAVGSLAEGTSRECEYGSLGGSMAYTHTDSAPAVQRKPAEKAAQTADEAYRPAMTAEEMRRAVVMAEILKRPQERMAEQARRWNLR